MDLNNSLVKKAWGFEYLFYRNEKVAIWLLNINSNQKTSLHAHRLKNTGLIVVDGIAKVSFLNNSITLKSIDKIMIFHGRFHQTTALSKKGVVLLEIETPEDKMDLVRFSDEYGRENQGYETKENYTEIPKDYLVIPSNTDNGEFNLFETKIKIYKPASKQELREKDFETTMIFLDGGIITNKGLLSQPGDVVSSHNLDLLLTKFDIAEGTCIMEISK